MGLYHYLKDARHLPKALYEVAEAKERPPDVANDLAFVNDACGGILRPMQASDELQAFHERLARLRPVRSMEIGTARGGTFYMLARRTSGTVVSVDLPGGPYGGGYASWRVPLYKSFAGPGQRVLLFRRDSQLRSTMETVQQHLDGLLDVLFIDGDHSYEGAKRDHDLYSPLVRRGGVIAFHDIVPHADERVGVWQLWRELKERHMSEELVTKTPLPHIGGGIGILRV